MNKKFEFLEHAADIKIKIYGKKIEEIFENAALAIKEYLICNSDSAPTNKRIVKIEGDNIESLLYKFVDEMLYLIDSEGFITFKAKVNIKNNKLNAIFFGDDAKKYEIQQIKAATYSEMNIAKAKKGWTAQLVIDV